MQEISEVKCKINKSSDWGKINDVLRIKDFCHSDESFYSGLISHRSKINTDVFSGLSRCNYEIYFESSGFLRFQNNKTEIKNTIVLISPNDATYEDAIAEINLRYTDRISNSEFKSIDNLNLKYEAIIFKEENIV